MLREDVQQPSNKPWTGSAPPEKISFVHDAGVSLDYTQGALKQTGATFDLGLKGDGFFQVQTANGNRLTRDGRFNPQRPGATGGPRRQSGAVQRRPAAAHRSEQDHAHHRP
ncbi:MAG: hypothetical protein WDN45_04890 [Caulobacteraceae bacterium]